MKLEFLRSECVFELVPTERGAKIRLEYSKENGNFFSVFKLYGNTIFNCEAKNNVLYVTNDYHAKSDATNFKMHVVMKVSGADFSNSYETESAFHLAIKDKKAEISVAISYISREMAELNLEREIGSFSFEEIKEAGKEAWEKKLSKIEIDADESEFIKFYSCMYRCFLCRRACALRKAFGKDGERGRRNTKGC